MRTRAFIRGKILKSGFLGELTDKEVAEKFDVGEVLVSKLRRKHGIESRKVVLLKWYRERLAKMKASPEIGKWTDISIAEHYGVGWTAVKAERCNRGLPEGEAPMPSPYKAMFAAWKAPKEAQGKTVNQWRAYVQS